MDNMQILILDDDGDYRKLLFTYLDGVFENTSLVEYDPLNEGIPGRDFKWSDYDVLILDYDLRSGEANGIDILQANRDNPDFPSTVMLTGAGNEDVAVMALKSGVCDYLRKDRISKEQLQESIRTAITRQQSRRERTYTVEEAQKAARAEAVRIINAYKAKYDGLYKSRLDKLQAEKARLEQEILDNKKIFEQLEKVMHGEGHEDTEMEVQELKEEETPVRRETRKVAIHIPGDETLQMKKWELEPVERKMEAAQQEQVMKQADLKKVKWKIQQEDASKKQFEDDIMNFRQTTKKEKEETREISAEKEQQLRTIKEETARKKQEEQQKNRDIMNDVSSQLKKE